MPSFGAHGLHGQQLAREHREFSLLLSPAILATKKLALTNIRYLPQADSKHVLSGGYVPVDTQAYSNGHIARRHAIKAGAFAIATAAVSRSAFAQTSATACLLSVPGTSLSYYLVAFDKRGNERAWSDGRFCSTKAEEELRQGQVTDVFIFSHGWMGDVAQAKIQYENWIGAMAECESDIEAIRRKRPGFKPLLVGLHWPSLPYGDEELKAGANRVDDQPELNLIADRIADTPTSRRAIQIILSAANQPTPDQLPPNVINAFRTLQAEAGLRTYGATAAPGADSETFDPNELYQSIRQDFEVRRYGAARVADDDYRYYLLYILALVSFWTMKDRARIVGESGGRQLLTRLQAAVPSGRDIRFHLMGHSFGCVVTSAMLGGGQKIVASIRPIHSLSLVQGALSLWSYTANAYSTGTPGYFWPLIERHLVAGPIVTTQSIHDTAVRVLYPYAAGVARQFHMAERNAKLPKYGGLGEHGIRGADCNPQSLEVLGLNQIYGLRPGQIYNVDCASVIKKMHPVSGAHSDISHPEIGHLVWEAASVEVPRPTPSPLGPTPAPTPTPPNGPLRRLIRRLKSE